MYRQPAARHYRDATVRVSGTAAIPSLLLGHGVDPADVLTKARLSPALFDSPDHEIPLSSLLLLLNRCAEVTGCRHFGLMVGEQGGLHSIGLVGLVARYSPDVETALRKLVSYTRLHNSGAIIDCMTAGAAATITYDIHLPGTEDPNQFFDGALATINNILLALCGRDWAPTEVQFAHRRPADVRPFRRFFRAPLCFDAPQNAIVFPARWLKLRLPEVDPELDRLLRDQIDALEASRGDTFPEQVRRVLRTGLLTGHAGADQVASLFSVHRRTLARRLDAFGTSFKEPRRRRSLRACPEDAHDDVHARGPDRRGARLCRCERLHACIPTLERHDASPMAGEKRAPGRARARWSPTVLKVAKVFWDSAAGESCRRSPPAAHTPAPRLAHRPTAASTTARSAGAASISHADGRRPAQADVKTCVVRRIRVNPGGAAWTEHLDANTATGADLSLHQQNNQIIDRLFWWYADQDFPPTRFDDMSPKPNQVKAKAMSPLCHTSVSKWVVTTGTTIKSEDTEHCVRCHGPDVPPQKARKWNQQGHMECLMCHEDHTA